ncbi:MAG: Gfo/Idh/MocA family oxidoreductase, partial [Chloroflexota bacterium]|nr:Gfo/Idh/MocA family oxidoreductase [Chloroflexota bacterium]
MESRREFLGHRLLDATALAAAAALPAGLPAQTESSRQIRMGVVGGGFGTHFDWHEHPNSTVAAVTDLRADRRDALQTKYRCDTVYDSLEEMLRRPEDLDAVAVFSGAPDHFKHVSMCMERGLHAFSAVPAVMTLEEADGLRDLKERTGLRYMMAETSYYRQPTIYARNLHGESGFGEVFYTELEYYHDRGDLDALLSDKTSRFYEPDGSRTWRWGLPPMHYPTHCLGFLVGVTRERIDRVSCLGWGGEHAWLEDNRYDNPYWCQSALMRTNRGNMSRCNVFWFVGGHGEQARWFGEQGSLFMSV